ncbi:hypothetical protein Q9966_005069 [Columba livia]|nr:hypothetical protein Q9966_005069 [Columba livia]
MRPPRGQPPPGPGQPFRAGGETGLPQRPPPPPPPPHPGPRPIPGATTAQLPRQRCRSGDANPRPSRRPRPPGGPDERQRSARARRRARASATGRRKGPAGRAAATGVRHRSAPAADSGSETGSFAPLRVPPQPGQRTGVPGRGRLLPPPAGDCTASHGLAWPPRVGWGRDQQLFHLDHDPIPAPLCLRTRRSFIPGFRDTTSLHVYHLNRELNNPPAHPPLRPQHRSPPRAPRQVPRAVTSYTTLKK